MGTGTSTSIYLLPCGDENETQIWYPLGFGTRMVIKLFYMDDNGIGNLSLSCYYTCGCSTRLLCGVWCWYCVVGKQTKTKVFNYSRVYGLTHYAPSCNPMG